MTAHTEIFAFAVSLTLAVLLAALLYSLRRARRRQSDPSLDNLVARLVAIDREKVGLIASAYDEQSVQEPDGEHQLEGWQVWEMMGGLEGFAALAENCTVLIDLACHVQQWYPEALPIAEQLRLNAREIQWHLDRLKGAQQRGHLEAVFPDYAQRAVAVYFRMTKNVSSLYEASQVPGWTRVQAAL